MATTRQRGVNAAEEASPEACPSCGADILNVESLPDSHRYYCYVLCLDAIGHISTVVCPSCHHSIQRQHVMPSFTVLG
jgi:ribosomal protein L32